jgi:predicted XRE-type DNA-binding protein
MLLDDGLSQREVASCFGVSRSNVNSIKHGLSWSHTNAE